MVTQCPAGLSPFLVEAIVAGTGHTEISGQRPLSPDTSAGLSPGIDYELPRGKGWAVPVSPQPGCLRGSTEPV